MGLFSKIKKEIQKIPKAVANAVKDLAEDLFGEMGELKTYNTDYKVGKVEVKSIDDTLIDIIIDTLKALIRAVENLLDLLIDFFRLFTDFIPYVSDGVPFFRIFIPAVLIVYISVEIYNSIYS